MKPIEQLNNVDKAKLLFQLFPTEIPALLEFAAGVQEAIAGNAEANRKQWDNGFLSFDFWLSLADEVAERINRYGKRMHHSHRLFGDQLFDGYHAAFMTHCLYLFTTTRQHPNPKFTKAVELLFNP